MTNRLFKDFSAQATFMGLLAAFAGFVSSFAVVLQGLLAVGATEAQAASGLAALSISMGLCAIVLSLWTRIPVTVAWSTPGAALLATTGLVDGGFPVAVGGFLVCGIAIIITGLWKPFGRLIAAIPKSLANAMLAGILLGLCLAPVKAISFSPAMGIPILLVWIIAGFFNRVLAVPAAFLTFCAVVWFGVDLPENAFDTVPIGFTLPTELVAPSFSLGGLINIAIPLYIVTMASQNIPGVAVLRSSGYTPDSGNWIATTGLFSVLSAPFGGHAVNLAAITAAMCAGEDAHPQPSRRYWAAIINGAGYVLFGLAAVSVTAFVSLAPAILIQAVAGLALVGAFSKATVDAFEDQSEREAAAVTFLFAASGISVLGISGAFWGLIAGALILTGLKLFRSKTRPTIR